MVSSWRVRQFSDDVKRGHPWAFSWKPATRETRSALTASLLRSITSPLGRSSDRPFFSVQFHSNEFPFPPFYSHRSRRSSQPRLRCAGNRAGGLHLPVSASNSAHSLRLSDALPVWLTASPAGQSTKVALTRSRT